MTPRLAGGLAAGTLAVGILTGAAGTIVIRDATTPNADFASVMADHMDGAITASMMGAGPGMMSGPAASFMPGSLHDQHHPAAGQDGAK